MIDISFLDTFKDAYLPWLLEKAGGKLKDTYLPWLLEKEEGMLDGQRLYLTKVPSLAETIAEELKKLNLSIELFIKAKANHDELTMRAALLRISNYLSGIFRILDNTADDVDRVIWVANLPKFPEGYKVPKSYNYFLD